MAYPSNDNTGAKNLVDFVVHLRDTEDSLKQTISDAKTDIASSVASAASSKTAAAQSAADAAASAESVASISTRVESLEGRADADESNIAELQTALPTYANWQKTETAPAVTCYPVEGSPLYSVVDFSYTETAPSSGDKGPDNPSTITGVSSIKVNQSGKNLYPINNIIDKASSIKILDNGDIEFSGTKTSGNLSYYACFSGMFNVGTDKYCHIVIKEFSNVNHSDGSDADGKAGLQVGYVDSRFRYNLTPSATIKSSSLVGKTLTCELVNSQPNAVNFLLVRGFAYSGTTWKVVIHIYVDDEETLIPENEEEQHYLTVITLNGTYYGGSVDLETGVMTVTHHGVESNDTTVDISSMPAALPLGYTDTCGRTITSDDGTSLTLSDSASLGGFTVYKLATPYTVQLSPVELTAFTQSDRYTPRLNTIYTDADSVTVGYAKSPIRTEEEITNAILSLGGNA